MALELRGYQHSIIDDVRSLMKKGVRRILIQGPTGMGKTALTANMIGASAKKGMRSLFMVHRRELINQSVASFDKAGVYHGIISAGFFEDRKPLVHIASVQSLSRRLGRIKPPKLIVWDECHHIAAGSWSRIFDKFPNSYHVGLTATPERLDGKGLDKWFDKIIIGPTVTWLIENKYLASYRLYAPSQISLEGIRTQMGDYRKSDLVQTLDKPTITGSVIREYMKVGYGKRAVVFAVSVDHSRHVVEQFNANNIPSMHVDGETPSDLRDSAIEKFRKGKIKVLSNVDLFGEGFDLPAIEIAILLRPTQSLSLYLQQVGRALRPSPGKDEAIILDHVRNCERHGLPDDVREWRLEGRGKVKKGESTGTGVKICDECFAALPVHSDKCKYCGYEFPKSPREVEHVEGELVEVDTDSSARKKYRRLQQVRAQTEEELVKLGELRGYKRPRLWARHIMKARRQKYGK